ncbi:IS66 family transposase [Massilia sp. TWR1-2-2]|uniref:IS66 family transposase n=1 Tax=Massilia sp. TWR1-2-2 TaxID=2804584 RepID=UPI003CF3FB23
MGRQGPVKQSVAFNLLKRFRLHADAVLLFITDHAVPFTNNLGERAVRMPNVNQKVSGNNTGFGKNRALRQRALQ